MQQNKKVNWIVEPCLFDKIGEFKRYNEFINIINKNGDNIGKNYDIIFEPQTCLSSLSTARDYGFYDKNTYCVSNYSKYLGKEFLNNKYIILPLSKLADASEFIAECIRLIGSFTAFIKPNSGFKSFTGDCVDYTEIGKFCRSLLQMGVSENELCIVSSAQDIESFEFRFWIIDNKIITNSVYSWSSLDNFDKIEPDEEMILYVEKIIKNINILAYTIDICICEKEFKVVEINNIYTSGTYNCDLEKLYVGLRDLAIKEYEDLNTI